MDEQLCVTAFRSDSKSVSSIACGIKDGSSSKRLEHPRCTDLFHVGALLGQHQISPGAVETPAENQLAPPNLRENSAPGFAFVGQIRPRGFEHEKQAHEV